jgi:hypothetical protein
VRLSVGQNGRRRAQGYVCKRQSRKLQSDTAFSWMGTIWVDCRPCRRQWPSRCTESKRAAPRGEGGRGGEKLSGKGRWKESVWGCAWLWWGTSLNGTRIARSVCSLRSKARESTGAVWCAESLSQRDCITTGGATRPPTTCKVAEGCDIVLSKSGLVALQQAKSQNAKSQKKDCTPKQSGFCCRSAKDGRKRNPKRKAAGRDDRTRGKRGCGLTCRDLLAGDYSLGDADKGVPRLAAIQ